VILFRVNGMRARSVVAVSYPIETSTEHRKFARCNGNLIDDLFAATDEDFNKAVAALRTHLGAAVTGTWS